MADRKKLYLVDGSGYIFRAYFAVRRLTTAKGVPTNAVFGFTSMLLKILRDYKPEHIAVAFDLAAPTFRHQMYPDYKANRPPPPEDLVPQFDLIRRVVEVLSIQVVSQQGYEADDVLGTLARQGVEKDFDVVILTGDKDLMQLVDDRVSLYDGMKDKEFGPQQVEERFGVPPELVVDVLGLAGDTSDNVPGVRGIGEKTAAALVREFGDLEKILAAAPDIKQKAKREKLMAQADQARLSKKLVTIDRQAPIDLDLEAIAYSGPDLDACRQFFFELEFTRLLRDPLFTGDKASDVNKPAPITNIDVDRSSYRAVLQLEELQQVAQQCRDAGTFALDTETDSTDPMRARLIGISLAWANNQAVYIPCRHHPALLDHQLTCDQLVEVLAPLLVDPGLKKVAQNGKYDHTVLQRHGFPPFTLSGDPMLASYLLDPGEMNHGLDALAKRHYDHTCISYKEVCGSGKQQVTIDKVPLDKAVAYAAEDADITLRVENLLKPRLQAATLDTLYHELELPLQRVLGEIERYGVLIDRHRLALMSKEMQTDLDQLNQSCMQLAGHDFNVASPKQVAKVLFEELELPVVKKTKTGPSTNAQVLETLSSQHPLPKLLLEHRTVSKLKSTYVDVLPALINEATGRVHSQFNQAVTATGRLSSSDPNLQNIPVRTTQGRRIREAFIAPEDHQLISADYSQIELRILAHVSQDPLFLEAFHKGQDIHRRTASEVFEVELDKVTDEQRRSAKAINFGLLYGMGPFRLAQTLDITRKEAKTYLDAYFQRYAGIRRWHDRTLMEAHTEGMVETLLGRRRLLPELASRNNNLRSQAERTAINTPIQGSAADIIKKAMLTTAANLSQQVPSAHMILQVHDELVVEAPTAEVEKAKEVLVAAMSSAIELSVPLVVDVGVADNWALAH